MCDGTDNFATRFLVADACVLARRTLVSGAVLRFDGQLSVFRPHLGGPCYRCLYPEPPPPGLVPSCSEAGVLGAVTGVIGTLQATEVLKEIMGIGETLAGRLLVWDALASRFRTVKLPRDPDCALCGPQATIHDLSAHADASETVQGQPVPSEPLGVLLLSGAHDRAHYAFVLASGAAALGRRGGAVRHQRRLPRAVHRLVRPDGRRARRARAGCAASPGWPSCARRRRRWACG